MIRHNKVGVNRRQVRNGGGVIHSKEDCKLHKCLFYTDVIEKDTLNLIPWKFDHCVKGCRGFPVINEQGSDQYYRTRFFRKKGTKLNEEDKRLGEAIFASKEKSRSHTYF